MRLLSWGVEDGTRDGLGYGSKEQWRRGPGGPGTNLDGFRHIRGTSNQYGNGKILLKGDPRNAVAGAVLAELHQGRGGENIGVYALLFAGWTKPPTLESRRNFLDDIMGWIQSVEGEDGVLFAEAPHYYSPFIEEALLAAGFVKVGIGETPIVDYDGANRDLFVRFTKRDGTVEEKLNRIRRLLSDKLPAFLNRVFIFDILHFAGGAESCVDAFSLPKIHTKFVHKKRTNTEHW